MTTVDPTRPRPGCAPPAETGLDDLVEGGDPLACEACLAVGGECEFHRGWAAGWDACAAFVAQVVEDERAAELAVELGDVEGVR
mgnify:CR=1 FL=1